MNNQKRSQYFTSASTLSEGDEYIDLEDLDQGVRVAKGVVEPMGNMIAKEDASTRHVGQHLDPHVLTPNRATQRALVGQAAFLRSPRLIIG